MLEPITITVLKGNTKRTLTANTGKTLLEIVREAGEFLDAPCGGKGRCGKCRVQIIQGDYLPENTLPEGFCLACSIIPKSSLTIRIPQKAEAFQTVSAGASFFNNQEQNPAGNWGIAIDIGTTTLAMHSVELATGKILDTWSGSNSQRSYGADVLSRIEAAMSGKAFALREIIRHDLENGIRQLLERAAFPEMLKKVCIAGNTTMLHLLRGYDCSGLGRAPFTPVSLSAESHNLNELISDRLPETEAVLLPGISAFVGADITSGIYLCDMDSSDKISMLLDMGTNAEMVLGNKNRLLCASTAAGPAFEGGNISHGMGSLPGAIQRVTIHGGRAEVTTISGAPPRGICGTGVLDAAAELFRVGILDETGLLEDAFFESGFVLCQNAEGGKIVLTQKDIREIQLAKAAIRAGIEALLKESGICAEKVEKVFLAGGFGFYLDIEKAISIGLLPKAFAGKIQPVGNSALAGCVKYLTHEKACERFQKIRKISSHIDLSENSIFRNGFLEYIDFSRQN